MKYQFKTNYVYFYITDEKGSQGKVTYKKGDVVQGIVSADKIKINITPIKVYDIETKKYITLSNIDVRSIFLEEIKITSGQGIDESSHTIKKYRFLKDYIYQYSSTSDGKQHTKQYKKGDIIYGQEIYNGIVTGFDNNPIPSKYLTGGAVGFQWVYLPLNVLGNVLEVVPEYKQGIPDTISSIKKYKVISNFTPQINDKRQGVYTTVMPYYKIGNIVYGNPTIRVEIKPTKDENGIRYQQPNPDDKNMMLISKDGNFRTDYQEYAPIGALEEIKTDKSDIKNETHPESKQSKIFTKNNILVGLVVIAVIGIGYVIIKK